MMDIVERLREQVRDDHIKGCQGREYSCDCGYDLKTEGLMELAAADIERLQGELAAMALDRNAHLQRAERAQAETERLRTDNEDMKRTLNAPIPWLLERDLRAEIEQLRADLDLRNQTALDRKKAIVELEAEDERLRAALTRIAAGGGDWEEARNVAINTLNDGTVPPPTAYVQQARKEN